jgi:hypothetical protein
MGMEDLIFRFPFARLLCFDNNVLYKLVDMRLTKPIRVIKHPYNISMIDPSACCDNGGEYILCATRFTPSKNIKQVVRCAGEHKLKIYGVDASNKEDMDFCKSKKNIELHCGRYSFEEIAGVYLGAKMALDGSKLAYPARRTQYSFMDAWRAHIPVLCDKDWMGDELINGVNCLELSKENVDILWKETGIAVDISVNGYDTLFNNHNPKDVRDSILETINTR